MAKIDGRSLSKDKREELKRDVFAAFEGKRNNVSAVARNLGITRQLIYRWLRQRERGEEDKEIGRTRFRLYPPDLRKLTEILVRNSPSQEGIDSPLWNVSSLHKLVEAKVPVEVNPYLVRRILLKLGFPSRQKVKTIFQRSYQETENLSALDYSRKYNMRCFYLTLINDMFVTAISSRGDIRFISKDYKTKESIANWVVELLYSRSKKKLLIVHNSYCLESALFKDYNVPKNVVILS